MTGKLVQMRLSGTLCGVSHHDDLETGLEKCLRFVSFSPYIDVRAVVSIYHMTPCVAVRALITVRGLLRTEAGKLFGEANRVPLLHRNNFRICCSTDIPTLRAQIHLR